MRPTTSGPSNPPGGSHGHCRTSAAHSPNSRISIASAAISRSSRTPSRFWSPVIFETAATSQAKYGCVRRLQTPAGASGTPGDGRQATSASGDSQNPPSVAVACSSRVETISRAVGPSSGSRRDSGSPQPLRRGVPASGTPGESPATAANPPANPSPRPSRPSPPNPSPAAIAAGAAGSSNSDGSDQTHRAGFPHRSAIRIGQAGSAGGLQATQAVAPAGLSEKRFPLQRGHGRADFPKNRESRSSATGAVEFMAN